MAKYCSGCDASLAHSDMLQQHIHQAPHSPWEGSFKGLAQT